MRIPDVMLGVNLKSTTLLRSIAPKPMSHIFWRVSRSSDLDPKILTPNCSKTPPTIIVAQHLLMHE